MIVIVGYTSVGMKMEWKLFVFLEEEWKRRGNMKMEMEIFKTETEMEFLCGNKNKNETVFSGGIDVETELSVSHDNLYFPLRRAYLLFLSPTLMQESW